MEWGGANSTWREGFPDRTALEGCRCCLPWNRGGRRSTLGLSLPPSLGRLGRAVGGTIGLLSFPELRTLPPASAGCQSWDSGLWVPAARFNGPPTIGSQTQRKNEVHALNTLRNQSSKTIAPLVNPADTARWQQRPWKLFVNCFEFGAVYFLNRWEQRFFFNKMKFNFIKPSESFNCFL